GTRAQTDHIVRLPARRSAVIEVHACRHDRDQDLTRAWTRRVDLLDLERLARIAEARLPDDLGQHPRRDVTYWRHLADRNRFFDSQGATPPYPGVSALTRDLGPPGSGRNGPSRASR